MVTNCDSRRTDRRSKLGHASPSPPPASPPPSRSTMTFNTNAQDDSPLHQPKASHFAHSSRQTRGPLETLLAFVLSAGLLVVAVMFSLAALAVVAIAGLVFAGWFWWK